MHHLHPCARRCHLAPSISCTRRVVCIPLRRMGRQRRVVCMCYLDLTSCVVVRGSEGHAAPTQRTPPPPRLPMIHTASPAPAPASMMPIRRPNSTASPDASPASLQISSNTAAASCRAARVSPAVNSRWHTRWRSMREPRGQKPGCWLASSVAGRQGGWVSDGRGVSCLNEEVGCVSGPWTLRAPPIPLHLAPSLLQVLIAAEARSVAATSAWHPTSISTTAHAHAALATPRFSQCCSQAQQLTCPQQLQRLPLLVAILQLLSAVQGGRHTCLVLGGWLLLLHSRCRRCTCCYNCRPRGLRGVTRRLLSWT